MCFPLSWLVSVHFIISCLELCMVCEARQREEQTQFAVVIFRGTELLQGVETLDCFLHGELQLKQKRNIFQTVTED